VHYSAAPRSPGKDFSGVPRTHQFLVTLMVHTNKTNATTAPTTASPTSVTDTDSVVAIPRDGQHPARSLATLRRGLAIAHDSGNRAAVTHLSNNLCLVEAEHGETLAFFDYCIVAIENYHDSGNTYMIRSPFGLLAAVFYRLGRYEPAATFAGFAATFPVAIALAPYGTEMTHLRSLLGEETYESLARRGEAMTIAEMVPYAHEQIDKARTQLNAVSE
jgi:hypothetical protein